jgi:hypothetical protein
MQVTSVRVARAGGIAPAPHLILFACMFVGQAALIALSPVLPEVARDFGVSTATAGQLRAVSGLVAGATAAGMGLIATRFGIRDLLILGLWLLVGGSLLSAAAPSFAVLAAAQVPVGAGLGIVLSAALAGAAEWVPDERRAGALSLDPHRAAHRVGGRAPGDRPRRAGELAAGLDRGPVRGGRGRAGGGGDEMPGRASPAHARRAGGKSGPAPVGAG